MMQVTAQVQDTLEVIERKLTDCEFELEKISCDTQVTKELVQTLDALANDVNNLATEYRYLQGLTDLFNKYGWELELCLYSSEYSYSIWVKDYPACKIEGLVKGIPTFEKLKNIVDDVRWNCSAMDLFEHQIRNLSVDADINNLDLEAIRQAAIEMDKQLPCLLTDLSTHKGGIRCA